MPTTRSQLLARLEDLAIETTTVDHRAVFTVAESALLERDIPGGHTKNLFLKCRKHQLFLIVALNDARIDLKNLHKKLGSARLSFAKAEIMMEVLGVRPGSVTPFALINDTGRKVKIILDVPMMAQEWLNYHPLENTATTCISRHDLLRFVSACGHEPRIMQISQ